VLEPALEPVLEYLPERVLLAQIVRLLLELGL